MTQQSHIIMESFGHGDYLDLNEFKKILTALLQADLEVDSSHILHDCTAIDITDQDTSANTENDVNCLFVTANVRFIIFNKI